MSSPTHTHARICRFPDCPRPVVPAESPGRPPEYCDDPAHHRAAAWRERQRRQGASGGPSDVRPVDAARQRASEIRGQVAGLMEHLEHQLHALVGELRTVADHEAAEAQIDAVTSEAAERVAASLARPSRAEQAQHRAEAERA